MYAGNDLAKARAQAQANANQTRRPWVLFRDTSGNLHVERQESCPALYCDHEVFYPEQTN